MAKLTSERVNGIRSGYWSPAKKEELAQRLGALEHRGPEMLSDICAHYCKYTERYEFSEEQRMELCDNCPMNHLLVMMGGVTVTRREQAIEQLLQEVECK